MTILRLERFVDLRDVCCFGVLRDEETRISTLELPWRDNRFNVSRIPAGIYEVRPRVSPKFGKCFRLVGTEPRTEILIHAGNTAEDTEGCILVGSYFGMLEGKPAVLASRTTLAGFVRKYPDGFMLHITEDRLT